MSTRKGMEFVEDKDVGGFEVPYPELPRLDNPYISQNKSRLIM